MPRQGVPYPSREICSLKCQIDALQRQINELMKSINGVQGDGQGNLSLISGDPAVVINSDASQNQIEIALDQSELPAAAVRMVNGMTGAVVLGANDIYAGANTVGFEIADLKAENLLRKQGITNEISNRQAADAALQSNINAVSAGLPAAAAAAVAADPTVAQLAVDVPNKLDKITSGSALKAYTHTGATQGEKSVVDGTAADSIAIRDADGRLQAADPASGATDKTLVTANWVSQTGDSAPNNLMHRSGNETVYGFKSFPDYIQGRQSYYVAPLIQNVGSKWFKIFSVTKGTFIASIEAIANLSYLKAQIDMRGGVVSAVAECKGERFSPDNIKIADDGTTYHIYIKYPQNRLCFCYITRLAGLQNQQYTDNVITIGDGTLEDEPTTPDYVNVYTSVGYT